MPCWEVRTMSVEFSVKHSMLLIKALREMDLRFQIDGSTVIVVGMGTIDLKRGVADITSSSQTVLNNIKQAYSKECVKKAAKLMQWQVKYDKKSKNVKGVMVR